MQRKGEYERLYGHNLSDDSNGLHFKCDRIKEGQAGICSGRCNGKLDPVQFWDECTNDNDQM